MIAEHLAEARRCMQAIRNRTPHPHPNDSDTGLAISHLIEAIDELLDEQPTFTDEPIALNQIAELASTEISGADFYDRVCEIVATTGRTITDAH